MTYLRLSVTDRCNLHCSYCRPPAGAVHHHRGIAQNSERPTDLKFRHMAGDHSIAPYQPKQNLLSFEEIVRLVKVLASLGIEKVRLTGGEPLLRRDIDKLCRQLSDVDGIKGLALTSNGVLLGDTLGRLHRAGVRHLNVSLDTLDRQKYRLLTGQDCLPAVLDSIDLAVAAGFAEVKLNCVLQRGVNDHCLADLVRFALARRVILRFIEAMPILPALFNSSSFLSMDEALSLLSRHFELQPAAPPQGPEPNRGPATEYLVDGRRGRIGFIASMSAPFCCECNRLRLLADGRLKTCLFAPASASLRPLLRSGATDDQLAEVVLQATRTKPMGHALTRKEIGTTSGDLTEEGTAPAFAESMVRIGG